MFIMRSCTGLGLESTPSMVSGRPKRIDGFKDLGAFQRRCLGLGSS